MDEPKPCGHVHCPSPPPFLHAISNSAHCTCLCRPMLMIIWQHCTGRIGKKWPMTPETIAQAAFCPRSNAECRDSSHSCPAITSQLNVNHCSLVAYLINNERSNQINTQTTIIL